MGVNNLKNDWYRVEKIAESAWHPVSDPPTASDADSYGYVAVLLSGKEFDCMYWSDVTDFASDCSLWARIRDVVLLPPEEP